MRLHTKLTYSEVCAALQRAKDAGKVTQDVTLVEDGQFGSQTHPRSFEIQLGTYDQRSLPVGTIDQHGKKMRVRRYKNTGSTGTSSYESVWAATWHEWGWFIAEVFAADPESRWGSNPAKSSRPVGYFSPEDFHAKTDNRFRPTVKVSAHP